jgi:hypothetical protein
LSTRPYFWIFATLSAILLIAPLRTGDLAGYDDASYAHMAKEVARTGDWSNIRSNGYPALEHPPLLKHSARHDGFAPSSRGRSPKMTPVGLWPPVLLPQWRK